jgi:hypothetical protein
MPANPLAVVLTGAALAASLGVTAALTAGSSRPEAPALGGGAVTPDGATVQGSTSGAANSPGNSPSSNPGHQIDVTGTVVGQLRPGSPATLTVSITNRNSQDIVVTSVTGTITSVTTRGLPGLPVCSTSWYTVGTSTAPTSIAKNKSGTVSVPVTLNDLPTTNQDNCKGSTVQLSFTAQARQA